MKTKTQAPQITAQRNTFTSAKFWDKITNIPKTHCEVIKKALTLYAIMTEADTPLWVKGGIVTALSYLIIPFDLIPDFLPGGFVDDMTVMAVLLLKLTAYVTPQVEQRVADYMPAHCL